MNHPPGTILVYFIRQLKEDFKTDGNYELGNIQNDFSGYNLELKENDGWE